MNFREAIEKAWAEKTPEERLMTLCKDAVNELCMLCGEYNEEHLGRCNGCRWKALRSGDFSNERIWGDDSQPNREADA